jgi:hypothetical protein
MAGGVFIIYIINYLINESKQSRKRQQQRKAAGSSRTSEPARPTAQTPSSNDIEDFLRRAAQQRKEAARPKELSPRSLAGYSRPPARPDPRTPPAKPVQRATQPPPTPRRLVDQPADIELAVVVPDQLSGNLAEHVARRLSTDEFASRASRMSDEMTRADIEREQHLKKMFGHQVGKLVTDEAPTSTETVATGLSPAAGLTPGGLGSLLRGDGLRYAVILNEIFGRQEDRGPVDRW